MQRLHTLSTRRRRARRSTLVLRETYRSPRLGNKDDPLDELVFILLSQMTTGPSYERVYERLKSAVPDWRLLLDIRLEHLTALIADAGLAVQRAARLHHIARRLAEDFGAVTLEPLAELSDEAVLHYLTALPGVGVKSAKCVMMYSLGRQVLPVDTHTARLAVRLALVASNDPTAADRELERVVPASLRYDFHVNAVAHGRTVCRAARPRCPECVLRRVCPATSR